MKIFLLNFISARQQFYSANPLNIFLHGPADSTTISNNDMRLAMQLLVSATCFKLFFRRFYLAALLIGPFVIALLLQTPALIAQTSGERPMPLT